MFIKSSIYVLIICVITCSLKAQERKTITCDYPGDEKAYKKWLDKDVFYIISKAEKEEFLTLKTNEERQEFIDSFWMKRDPTPDTEENEFRDEYYQRIAFANENFASGIPGWRTDRGRIHILYGKPDKTERGYSSFKDSVNVLYESWHYNYISGIGGDIEMFFIDPMETDEFRLLKKEEQKFFEVFTRDMDEDALKLLQKP